MTAQVTALPRHYETRFAGEPAQVAQVRRWTRQVLAEARFPGDLADDVLICVSELAGNAVKHTRSGQPGGKFTVIVETRPAGVRVEVLDQGSADGCRPEVLLGGGESGRGLWVCAVLGVVTCTVTESGCRVSVDLPHDRPVGDLVAAAGGRRS